MTAKPAPGTLRIGVIGTGFGQAVHIPAFQATAGVEVVAIAASRLDAARKVADKFGIEHAFSDYATLLDQVELDAVSLALPPAVGTEAVKMALAKGLAVLTEKPLAPTVGQARELAALAQGRIASVNFGFAELDCFRQLKGFIESRRFGGVRTVHVIWRSHSYAHRHAIWSWKLDRTRNGGVMVALGTHVLYLLDWLFGKVSIDHARFESRATEAIAPAGATAAEDGVDFLFRFESGGVGHASLSNASPGCADHRWEIVFDAGKLVIGREGAGHMSGFSMRFHDDLGNRLELLPAISAAEGVDDRLPPFRSLAARFIESVRTRQPCQPDFAAGARVQQLHDDMRHEPAQTIRGSA